MGVRRDHRTVETSDSEDITEDDSASGDAWQTRSSSRASSVNVTTARTDVAVDYSIASSSHTSSGQSTAARPANTPRRHTGPRKRRVGEKVRGLWQICLLTSVGGWLHGTVVERRSLAVELSLSYARPAADG